MTYPRMFIIENEEDQTYSPNIKYYEMLMIDKVFFDTYSLVGLFKTEDFRRFEVSRDLMGVRANKEELSKFKDKLFQDSSNTRTLTMSLLTMKKFANRGTDNTFKVPKEFLLEFPEFYI